MISGIAPRWLRNYELLVGLYSTAAGPLTLADTLKVGDKIAVIQPPLRVSFEAHKSITGGLNKMRVKIFNLAENTRLRLVKDAEEGEKLIPFQFSIGYEGGKLESIFKGTVHIGRNAKEGTDIVTELESLDGGLDFINAFTSRVAQVNPVLESLVDAPNTTVGKIRTAPTLVRPKVMVGNTFSLIDETLQPGDTWFIDDEQLYIIGADQACGILATPFLPVVSADSGLLGVPTRENKKMTCKTMLNPSVKVGRLFSLKSKIAPHLNGVYRADTIAYSGDFNGADWSQTITGMLGNFRPVT